MSEPIPENPSAPVRPSQEARSPRRRGKPGQADALPVRPARPVHPLLQRLWELHPRLFGARCGGVTARSSSRSVSTTMLRADRK